MAMEIKFREMVETKMIWRRSGIEDKINKQHVFLSIKS